MGLKEGRSSYPPGIHNNDNRKLLSYTLYIQASPIDNKSVVIRSGVPFCVHTRCALRTPQCYVSNSSAGKSSECMLPSFLIMMPPIVTVTVDS